MNKQPSSSALSNSGSVHVPTDQNPCSFMPPLQAICSPMPGFSLHGTEHRLPPLITYNIPDSWPGPDQYHLSLSDIPSK